MKTLTLKNKFQTNATLLPNDFIDNYMIDANGEFVKVYLFLLRHLDDPFSSLTLTTIADCLNNTEKDIHIVGAEDPGGLDQRVVNAADAVENRDGHGHECADPNQDDLGRLTDAGRNHDQRRVSQGGDVADEVDPGLDDLTHRHVPGHQKRDRHCGDKTQSKTSGDRSQAAGQI